MSVIDRMSKPMRGLVHEFGYVIVAQMRAEGYMDAKALRPILEGWRRRRQDEWLQTNYVQARTIANIQRAL